MGRRPYQAQVRWAGTALTVWWAAFGAEALTDAGRIWLAVAGEPPAELYFTLARAKIVFAGVAIWALGFYVTFLWTGTSRWGLSFAGLGLIHATFFLTTMEARVPSEVVVGTWAPRMVLAAPSSTLPILQAVQLLMFFLPPILLALALILLARRVGTRTRRVRALAVATVILVWHGTQVIQSNPETSGDSPIFLVLSALNILAAGLAYITYYPPAILQRRWGLHTLDQESDRARTA